MPVVQWACNGGDNQTWNVEPALDGYSRVIARHSGKCLDVSGASTDDGAGSFSGSVMAARISSGGSRLSPEDINSSPATVANAWM